MKNILSEEKAGGSYWKLQVQDMPTGAIYSEYMHETEYKLRKYEQSVLGKIVTQEILTELRDLIHDVEYHERCMEENEE